MARVELAPEVADDFDRILDHLIRYQVEDVNARVRDIIAAISVLERNPLIGRPVDRGRRELVIGRGSRGYVAVYRYVTEIDTVFVLAVRSQREAGYTQDRSTPP
jgi:toxin ParE1/3/4